MKKVSEKKSVLNKNAASVKKETNAKPTPAATKKKTAKTEEAEFNGIYKLDVIRIPTNRPCVRIDEPDIVYRTEKGKLNAIIEEIKERHEKGQPILVGTVNIDKSEEYSRALTRAGIKHTAKNQKQRRMPLLFCC